MPLSATWTDALFAKLSVRYGAAFLRQWPDADPAHVKADWAEVLDGFDGESIGYALRYLPINPPNAIQFRETCRRAPRADVPALPAPADPVAAAKAISAIREAMEPAKGVSAAQQCIDNITRLQKVHGLRLTLAHRAMLESCRKVVGNVDA